MRSSMSKMALLRCRVLIVANESDEPYSRVLSVIDPRRNYQVVASYKSRTEADTHRIIQRFSGSHRIPKELVFTRPTVDLPTPDEIIGKISALFEEDA